MKYSYAYDKKGEILSATECEKNETYFADYNLTVKLVKAEGEQRQYLRLANNNVFADIGRGGNSQGESEEHFNAKMKIVKDGGYFDTIFDQFVSANKLIPEFKQGNKKPDISCYDENNNLVMCIEIFHTHKKSEKDIEELRKLNVPVIEIDIKNGNKCRHIILTALLERHDAAIRSNYREQREIQKSINDIEGRFDKAIQRISNERGADFEKIQVEYSYLEREIKKERTTRVFRIDKWIQGRKEDIKRKVFAIESNKWSIIEQDERYKQIESDLKQKRNAIIDNIKIIKGRRRKILSYDKYHRLGNSIVEQIENIKKKIK